MRSKVLCSSGAFIGRVNGRNYKLIIENAQKIHCDGFEFMMYHSWYDVMDQLVYDLKATDIKFPIVHVDKQGGEIISRNAKNDIEYALELFEKNCKIAKELGSGTPSSFTDFYRLQRELQPYARTVSFDNAGFGWNEKTDIPRTIDVLSEELHELLLEVIRFAQKYPTEVKGIVLLDGLILSI